MENVIKNTYEGWVHSIILSPEDKKNTPFLEKTGWEVLKNYFFMGFCELSINTCFTKEISTGIGKKIVLSLPVALFSVTVQKIAQHLEGTSYVFLKKSFVCLSHSVPILRNTTTIIASLALTYFGSPVLGLSLLGFGLIDLMQKKKWMPKSLHLIANWSSKVVILLSFGNTPGISLLVSSLIKGATVSFSAVFLLITVAEIAQSVYFSCYPRISHPVKNIILENVHAFRRSILTKISSSEGIVPVMKEPFKDISLFHSDDQLRCPLPILSSNLYLNSNPFYSLPPSEKMKSKILPLLEFFESGIASEEMIVEILRNQIENDKDLREEVENWLEKQKMQTQDMYISYYKDLEPSRYVMKDQYLAFLFIKTHDFFVKKTPLNDLEVYIEKVCLNHSAESIQSATQLANFFYPSALKHLWGLKKNPSLNPLNPLMQSILNFLLNDLSRTLCPQEILIEFLEQLIEKDENVREQIKDWLEEQGKTVEEAYISYYQNLEVERWVMKKDYILLLLDYCNL